MRRVGAGIAILLLLAGTWTVTRWLRVARPLDVPTASLAARTPENDVESLLEPVALDVQPSDDARAVQEPAQLNRSDRAAAAENSETGCVVRVVDRLGASIAGARVSFAQRPAIAPQITDAEGRCRFTGDVGVLFMTDVLAEAEGFFPAEETYVGQPELVVHLRSAAQASGRVLDRTTLAPLTGVRVSTRGRGGSGVGVEAGYAVTDESGRFDGLSVPSGDSFLVDVQARGYLWPRPISRSIAGEPGHPDSALELLLDPAKPGYVQVVDGEDGRPLAGASVTIGRTTLATDLDGRVCFESELPPADLLHWATVMAEDHCGARFELQGSGSPAAPVVVRLPRSCRVEGTVRSAGDEELSGCWLRAEMDGENAPSPMRDDSLPEGVDRTGWPENAKWSEIHLRTTFDERIPGRIEIEGVPAGLPALKLTLFGEAGTLGERRIGPMGASGTTLRFDWELEPPGTARLSGRVMLDGEPHAASLSLSREGFERVTSAGDDGRYAFEKLSAGSHELRCELRSEDLGWGELGVQALTIDVAPGANATRDLQFQIAMSAIRGTLSDAGGAPLTGVHVQATHAASRISSWCSSEPDGTWSLRVPVVDTPYELSCFQVKLREPRLEVLAGTEGVALQARARGRLRFRVLDATTGRVITSPALARPREGNLTQSIGGPTWPGMDASGWCEKELTEGPIELAAFTHDGLHRADRRSLVIPSDGVVEVEFRLAPANAIELRLALEGGPLPKHHVVQLLHEAEWELATAVVGQGYPKVSFDALPFDPMRKSDFGLWPGRVQSIGGLAPGLYRFKAFPDDVTIAPEWIDVPTEGVVDVTWTFKP